MEAQSTEQHAGPKLYERDGPPAMAIKEGPSCILSPQMVPIYLLPWIGWTMCLQMNHYRLVHNEGYRALNIRDPHGPLLLRIARCTT